METNQLEVSVFGIFKNRSSTENAFDQLKDFGFRNSDISVLMTDQNTSKSFAHEKHSYAPEGTAAGVAIGALVGATWGWLSGTGQLENTSLAVFVAAGPMMSLLAGMGLGVSFGGLLGALVGLSVPKFVAKRYRGFAKDAGILMSVHCESSEWIKRAKDLLKRNGAMSITASHESRP